MEFHRACVVAMEHFVINDTTRSEARDHAVPTQAGQAPVPVISVVVPSLNQGEFIEQCLSSILRQKGDFIIDCIVVDGGSKDDSVSIIRGAEELLVAHCERVSWAGGTLYLSREPSFPFNRCRGVSFTWASESDNGQVDALKKGFAAARGEVLGWLCSDDYYLTDDVYSTICQHFSADPELSLLFGDGILVSRQGQSYGRHHVATINLRELILLDYHILQPASFFHRTFFRAEDLQDKYLCAFDADFFLKKLVRGEKFKKINEAFAAFRVWEDSKTIALQARKCAELLDISREYPQNVFFRAVSRIYRWAEVSLKPKWHTNRGIRHLLFRGVRVLCYLLITGRIRRGGGEPS